MNTYQCNKPEHFIKFYESHILTRKPNKLLEIGVQTGRSLRMWRRALPTARIIGLDINEPTEELDEGIDFVQGSQTDEKLLSSLSFFDVIIDDGSHMTADQQKTYQLLFPRLKSGGLYVIEDLEPSREQEFKNSPLSTLEYFAQMLPKQIYTHEGIKSITFADNFLAVEKL